MTTKLKRVRPRTSVIALPGAGPSMPSSIKVTQQGLMTFRLTIEHGSHKVMFETHAHAIALGIRHANRKRGVVPTVIRIAGTLLYARTPLLEMDWYEWSQSPGTPGWIDLPVECLQTEVGSRTLLAEVNRLCEAKKTKLPESSDSSGTYYSGWTAPASDRGKLITEISDINIADISSQDPSTELCGFDPHWKIRYLYSGGTKSLCVEEGVAGPYLLESIFTGFEAERELNELFRTMSVEHPPVLSAELAAKLDRLGWTFSAWDEAALKGDPEAMRQSRGKTCSMYVPIPMREAVDYRSYCKPDEVNPPTSGRIGTALMIIPLEMAIGIAIASYRAGWRPKESKKLLALDATTPT